MTTLSCHGGEAAMHGERSPLYNSFTKLVQQKALKVVVVGNSVTAGAPEGDDVHPSFYVALERWLQATFPDAEVSVVPKIIFAIGPEVQLFYLDERVIAEKPDLVLAEFGAANGAWGEAGAAVTEPATEGWMRRVRAQLPETDIILMMGMFQSMMAAYEAGTTPASAAFLHRTAEHYNALPVDAGKAMAERILQGEAWDSFMDDVIHPSPGGYRLYSETLIEAVSAEWHRFPVRSPDFHPVSAHVLPDQTLHDSPWMEPKRVPSGVADTELFEERSHPPVVYLHTKDAGARGRYRAPDGRKVVGMLFREKNPGNNLEIRHPEGHWLRLGRKWEPVFTVKEDPENRLYRNFFAAYGLPVRMGEVEFRASSDPEYPDGTYIEIVSFLEVSE